MNKKGKGESKGNVLELFLNGRFSFANLLLQTFQDLVGFAATKRKRERLKSRNTH
jgi:hypothetical protein